MSDYKKKLDELEAKWKPLSEAALKAQADEKVKAQELAALQKRAVARWQESNVPERHAKMVALKGKEWTAAMSKVRLMSDDALIALVGPPGTGKTQIAVELIRQVTSQGKSALWTTVTDFFMDVKACYRDETKTTEREIVQRYSKRDLLVIDEFHRRRGSEWENILLFQVIDRVYYAGKRLVVIANQTPDEFEASIDGALMERFNETGGIIACNWASFR